jgi:predicted RNase H-like HicB family nuclease
MAGGTWRDNIGESLEPQGHVSGVMLLLFPISWQEYQLVVGSVKPIERLIEGALHLFHDKSRASISEDWGRREMPRTIEITVELTPDLEVGGYVAYCPELDITAEREMIKEAMAIMKEAAEGYLELVGLDVPTQRIAERVVRKLSLTANV